jgi:hypothetical protein
MGDEDFVDEFEESLASEPPSPQKQSPKKTSPQQTTPSQKYTAESLLLDNSLMSSMQSVDSAAAPLGDDLEKLSDTQIYLLAHASSGLTHPLAATGT